MSSYIAVSCPECDRESMYNCDNTTTREHLLKLLDAYGRECKWCGARMIQLEE